MRYSLEKYTGKKSRHTCPKCGKPQKFTLYIDNETGEYIADQVGRCDRENSCSYHYTPKEYFSDNGIVNNKVSNNTNIGSNQKSYAPSTHSYKLVEASREVELLLNCNFILFLNDHFDSSIVEDLINLYKLGATVDGEVIFWQLDIDCKIRAGKIMAYSRGGHRRGHPNWMHSKMEVKGFNLKQCFFGEHLLSDEPDKKVCIVESEKTALICQAIFSDMLWLATGGIHGLSDPNKLKVLKGRDVILWPDIDAYDKWKTIALKYGFGISDYLEENAQKSDSGKDLADFLIEEDLELF